MPDRLTFAGNRFLMSRGSVEMTVRSVDCETIEFGMFCKRILGGRGGLIGFESNDVGDVSQKTVSSFAF